MVQGNSIRLQEASRISIIAMGILAMVAFLHFAAAIVITILVSILLAIALEPVVEFFMKYMRASRTLASALAVLLVAVSMYSVLYAAYIGVARFYRDLPALVEKVQKAPIVKMGLDQADTLMNTMEEARKKFAAVNPLSSETLAQTSESRNVSSSHAAPQVIYVRDSSAANPATVVLREVRSFGHVFFSLGFIPFLAYFLLAAKKELVDRISVLFGDEHRRRSASVMERMEIILRRFLIGNLMVSGVVCFATSTTFWVMGLPYGILLGVLSGLLSSIPYLGAFLSLLPGVVVGLVVYSSVVPFLVISAAVTILHFLAIHVLTPLVVGEGTGLNATASTIAILFFGWLWGGIGLMLGIPIFGAVKVVMDVIPATRTVGFLLGSEREMKDLSDILPPEPLKSAV